MTPLNVLIVGCGNIAGLFDSGRRSRGEPPLTHAGAFLRDGRFRLAGCVEPDDERRAAFMRAWGITVGVRTLDEAARVPLQYDVISICSPTKHHAEGLDVAVRIKPRLIFCEKPVTTSATQTESAVRRCKESDIALAVNYTRRWDPAISTFASEIRAGRWGQLRSVVGYYNKGLLNNGSHLLDLLSMLLGPLRVVSVGKPVHDFVPEDPTVPVWLETPDELPVQLACGHARDFALFELQFIFANAVITMEEGGMFWRVRIPVESDTFAGYRVPGAGVRRAGDYPQAMLRSVDNIFGAIAHGHALASTGESALTAQRLCEQIGHQ